MKYLIPILMAAIVVTPTHHAREDSPKEAALAFIKALTPGLQGVVKQPFDSNERTAWKYVPGLRVGVSWKQLKSDEKRNAEALLKTSLSEAGFSKAEGVRTLESVLRDLEGAGRDPDYYVFTIFGEPSDKGVWGWRYEGHHLSLNFTYKDGKCIATTPQFFGANPAEVMSGPHKGFRLLAPEEDKARELLASLSEEQKKKAVLTDKAPAEIVTSNLRKAVIQEDRGLAESEMTSSQAKILQDLVRVHANALAPAQMKARLDKIEKAGWVKVKFAWLGGTQKGQGWYYRIQGAAFLIEVDDTQNKANHIHSVWRDFNGDFGEDELAHHYATAAHHKHH